MSPARAFLFASSVVFACSTAANAANDLEADPTHHKLELQNDYFQVNRASFGAREMSDDFFDAEEALIIALTPLRMRLHFPDGTSADPPPTPAGAAVWVPPGRFRPENLLNQRSEFLVVFPRGENGRSVRTGVDPLTVEPDNWKAEVDNEAVRALRYRAGPRAKGIRHGHSDHLVVFLTNGKNLVDRPDGQTFIAVRKRGEVISAPAGEHAPENLLDEPLEVLLVERK
jgi:hypothetical protein